MTKHTVTITNRNNSKYKVDNRRPLLDALRAVSYTHLRAHETRHCITCAAKLTDGKVDQKRQVALNNRQLSFGYVILCVARAKSDLTLEIGVESHDKLYRNPFLDPLKQHELKPDIATSEEI